MKFSKHQYKLFYLFMTILFITITIEDYNSGDSTFLGFEIGNTTLLMFDVGFTAYWAYRLYHYTHGKGK